MRSFVRPLLGVLLVGLSVVAAGCGADTSQVTSDAVVPLEKAPLDRAAGKRVVGIGEATHGNREFVQVRQQIIATLVRDHGFRTVALEADFGGTAVANDYVLAGQGSAEAAAYALGFDIYRTRETAELLRWIHDHNTAVAGGDKVRVYGFDMQRYDHNKARLLRYLATVDPDLVRPVQTSFAALTDATRSEQDKGKVATAAAAAARLVDQMRQNREAYVRASSRESFVLAVHHAETIQRGAELQTSGADYARIRDAWMAENVTWIADLEARHGRKQIVVAGHNSHIDETGAAFGFAAMGERLARSFGADYFTIGTEFGTSTFLARDEGSGERRQFTVHHETALAKLFGDVPLGYVDLARASSQAGNRELLRTPVRMGNVGDSFRSLYRHLSWAYTVTMVPAQAYDALVYVPHAGPVTPL